MTLKSKWESSKRIETLVDGIFAIAMTIMVLSITTLQLNNPSSADLTNAILNLSSNFFAYALSFLLLGVFWRVNHSQFYHIKTVDVSLIWITLIWLLFVALVPFSSNLFGEYGNLTPAPVFFGFNILAIGVLSAVTWYYATENKLTDNKLTLNEIRYIRKKNLALPLASILQIGLAFIIPVYSGLGYLVIPLIHKFIEKNQE